jgi:DNA-directed RNA polymerase subunit RPC12/RpoP
VKYEPEIVHRLAVVMKKCGRCSKPAVLHITELQHGEVQALHLCETCAKEYLSQAPSAPPEEMPASIEAESEEDLDELDQRVCPNCGITLKMSCCHFSKISTVKPSTVERFPSAPPIPVSDSSS